MHMTTSLSTGKKLEFISTILEWYKQAYLAQEVSLLCSVIHKKINDIFS